MKIDDKILQILNYISDINALKKIELCFDFGTLDFVRLAVTNESIQNNMMDIEIISREEKNKGKTIFYETITINDDTALRIYNLMSYLKKNEHYRVELPEGKAIYEIGECIYGKLYNKPENVEINGYPRRETCVNCNFFNGKDCNLGFKRATKKCKILE